MKNNFWNELKRPFFVLAPMEDVTDVVFRQVIKTAATPDVFFTEFTNSESYVHAVAKESLRGRLTIGEQEGPLVAHIWGDNPEYFKTMSFGLAEMGFDGIDINMGCPAPNVFKHGRGSGLILRPELAAEIIQATKAGGLPVSVKTRLGHAKVDEWKEWLTVILKQDIANLSIHLRTKVEMSKVPAHWELIEDIVALRDAIAPQTLITVNGDIMDYAQGMEIVEKTGVDGIMIGRGVFHNPFAFDRTNQEVTHEKLFELFHAHLNLYEYYVGKEPRLAKPLQRFFKVYLKEMHGISALRQELMETTSIEEIRSALIAFETEHAMNVDHSLGLK